MDPRINHLLAPTYRERDRQIADARRAAPSLRFRGLRGGWPAGRTVNPRLGATPPRAVARL
jgi:hypothetical protein